MAKWMFTRSSFTARWTSFAVIITARCLNDTTVQYQNHHTHHLGAAMGTMVNAQTQGSDYLHAIVRFSSQLIDQSKKLNEE